MKTIIIPGYSIANRDWAEEVAKNLPDSQVHYWKHWQDDKTSVRDETGDIQNEIGSHKVNLVVKSIGTLVVSMIIPKIEKQIEKVIFCGIPLNDIPEDLEPYKALNLLNPQKILVIQNENDQHGSYKQIKEFLGNINPQIKVISKPASDHNYPYYKDFSDFLS